MVGGMRAAEVRAARSRNCSRVQRIAASDFIAASPASVISNAESSPQSNPLRRHSRATVLASALNLVPLRSTRDPPQ